MSKVLTIRQPYATLIALGAKRVETRSWYTGYTGPVWIHAGKAKLDDEGDALCRDEAREVLIAAGITRASELPYGAIIAQGVLRCCKPAEYLKFRIKPRERAFGNFGDNRWGWVFAEVRRLAVPIPLKGALGLFDWNPPAGQKFEWEIAKEPCRDETDD